MLQSILQNPNAIPFVLMVMLAGVVLVVTLVSLAASRVIDWWFNNGPQW